MSECCGGCGPTTDTELQGLKNIAETISSGVRMREFDTGATRDSDSDKLDYEGFLSPLALTEFARYMHRHRIQADGTLRDSDNWQKGIPLDAYMKSMWRHFMEVWTIHRGHNVADMQDALCALMFNVMGYLHEELREPTDLSGGYD